MLQYDLPDEVLAFTTGKSCHGGEPGVDARETGIQAQHVNIPSVQVMIPRQTHSVNVVWAEGPGEAPDSDAAITRIPGLCVAVKTADCIPVLLYDRRQQLVAAVHAGWRGTVGRIVTKTLEEMKSRGEDVWAIIGPGISLDAFEVGDEVYEAFRSAGFPMDKMARRYPVRKLNNVSLEKDGSEKAGIGTENDITAEKWHLDLWAANRWLLEDAGIQHIQVAGICTYSHYDDYYSARRETIRTGRNINGIMLK